MIKINIPGWVDLQVNGYKGINFSDSKLTLKDIQLINKLLLEDGIIGYCPTLISSPLKIYQRNLSLISQTIHQEDGAQILGIHIEGPFINPEEGIRGIHRRENIMPINIDSFEKIYKWAEGNISIITIAPEIKGAIQLIEHITNSTNIIVSIGHSMAKKEAIDGAINAGAKAATHIGNGIPENIPRHSNPLWPLLANDQIFGLFITDGFHIPPDLIRVGLRAKGVSKFIIISDLVHIAGHKPGEYIFENSPVILENNGYLHRKDSFLLAGSTKTMMDCMNFLASIENLGLKDFNKIGFKNPLNLIKKNIPNKKKLKISFKNNRFCLNNE